MPFTQRQVEKLHQFREHAASFPPRTKTRTICKVRYSDEESLIMVRLRLIACEVVLRSLATEAAKAKFTRITDLIRGEGGADPAMNELLEGVEDSIAFVEVENSVITA